MGIVTQAGAAGAEARAGLVVVEATAAEARAEARQQALGALETLAAVVRAGKGALEALAPLAATAPAILEGVGRALASAQAALETLWGALLLRGLLIRSRSAPLFHVTLSASAPLLGAIPRSAARYFVEELSCPKSP